MKGLLASGEKGLLEIVARTHAGMTTAEFDQIVRNWFKTARHPRFNRSYNQLVYQPMLELLAYLRANGFKTLIVSGGGVEFMRAFAPDAYGIPPDQIVGSMGKLKYEMQNGKPVMPTVIRWPGVIKPGQIINDMCAHEDLIPTFCAAAGEPDIVAKVLKGYQAGGKTFKVHLDGYNLMPFLKGEAKESPRKEFIYWSDDGDVFAIRFGRWKTVFLEQNHEGLDIWRLGFEKLRVANMYDLLADPFERGDKSFKYDNWLVHHAYINYGAVALVSQWLATFKEFPPRQKPASFNLDEVMRKMTEQPGSN